MSYGTNNRNGGYGGRSRKGSFSRRYSGKDPQEIQAQRSIQAKLMDSSRRAPLAKSFDEWADKPNRLDLPGVDAPNDNASAINADSKSEFTVFQSKYRHWTQVILEKTPSGGYNKIVMEFGKEKSRRPLTEAEKTEALESLKHLEKIGAGTVTRTDNLAALRQVVGSVNTPKEEAVKPNDKAPWEMTYREFFDKAGSEFTAAERFGLTYHGRVPTFLKKVEGKEMWVGEQGATPEERIHRAVIRQALAQGKTVPPEVLKQYPDLVAAPVTSTPIKEMPKPKAQTKPDASSLVYEASIGHYGGVLVSVPEDKLADFKALFPPGVFPKNIEVKNVKDSWSSYGVADWQKKFPRSERVAIVRFANASKGEKFIEDNMKLPFRD